MYNITSFGMNTLEHDIVLHVFLLTNVKQTIDLNYIKKKNMRVR